METIQEKLGEMTYEEVELIQALREDNKKTWWMYGKSLEVSLSIEGNNIRPRLSRGQANVLKFIVAIDDYMENGKISEDLILLVKMKKSKYREALIEYKIWTEEIYLDIYNKYTDQKKLK